MNSNGKSRLKGKAIEQPGPVLSFIIENAVWIFLGIVVFMWICVITAKLLDWITLSWVSVTLGFLLALFWLFVALLLLIFACIVLPKIPGFLLTQLFRILSRNPAKMPVWPYVMFGAIAVPLCILSRTGSWFALVWGIFLFFCFVCGVIAYQYRSENAERRRIAAAKKRAKEGTNPHLEDPGSSEVEKHATPSVDSAPSRAPEPPATELKPVVSSAESKALVKPSSASSEDKTSDPTATSSSVGAAASSETPTPPVAMTREEYTTHFQALREKNGIRTMTRIPEAMVIPGRPLRGTAQGPEPNLAAR